VSGWPRDGTSSIRGVTATSPRLGRRRVTGIVLTVAAALTASACGTMQAGAAAVIGDRRISVGQLQQATTDIQTYVSAVPSADGTKQTVDQGKVLLFMILQPYLSRTASDAGVGVSDDQARTELKDRQVPDPTQGAVDAIRALDALNNLQQGSKQQELTAFADQLRRAKIEVNPRYGRFDPNNLDIVAVTPDWLATSPSPSTTAGLGSSGSSGGSGGSGSSPAPTSTP
jgi:hypothetical protein